MKTILIATLISTAALSFADDFSLLGTWQGRLTIDTPPLPANASGAQRARRDRELATIRNGRLTLRMFRDHRYTIHNDGLAILGPADTRGIWSKRGSTLSLIKTGTSKPFPLYLDSSSRRLTASAVFGPTTAKFVFTR